MTNFPFSPLAAGLAWQKIHLHGRCKPDSTGNKSVSTHRWFVVFCFFLGFGFILLSFVLCQSIETVPGRRDVQETMSSPLFELYRSRQLHQTRSRVAEVSGKIILQVQQSQMPHLMDQNLKWLEFSLESQDIGENPGSCWEDNNLLPLMPRW